VTVGGQLAELRSCGVFEIEDGHILAWRDYFDPGSLAGDDRPV
jgi:limonene-1,2-epoxide hydrolase